MSELSVTCDCRKPEPGMLLKAMHEWPIDTELAFLIGDKISDVEAARHAGVRGVLYDGCVELTDVVRQLF